MDDYDVEERIDMFEFDEYMDNNIVSFEGRSEGKSAYKKCKNIGPGGIKCKCCRMYGTSKEAGMHINKVERHSVKQMIKEEIMAM